ncbi:MAG TPA: 30S ribosomal protein S4 [Thermoplasmata archaeon]|nr:30S ribosomal protein S4 [Thermoplasmata archaeon]
MGDPKFSRRIFRRPSHPWEGERIKMENELLKKYGLKNKKELWKAQSVLRRFRQRARQLQALVRYGDPQAGKEKDELIGRLGRLGVLPIEGASLDDVLALDVEAVLSRRLQTLAFVKGLAFTPTQARQFIVHGHVAIGDRRVTVPGYLVKRTEEVVIAYDPRSPISHDLHPARPGAQPAEATPEGAPGPATPAPAGGPAPGGASP